MTTQLLCQIHCQILCQIIFTCLVVNGISTSAYSASFSPLIIFGEDNRQEIYATPKPWFEISQSVAAKISIEHLIDGNLIGSPLSKRVCPGTRFEQQITVANCTGFLVKPNIMVTAGHCVKTQDDCDKFVWVFDFALRSQSDTTYTQVQPNQIYKCLKIHNRRYEGFGAVDYAILELERPVENRQPLKLGHNLAITPGSLVTSIGHPIGLPQKFIDNASVIRLSDADRTIDTDLDVFQGNSGSPVFDAATGLVISITSHGHEDLTRDPVNFCKNLKVCKPGDNCYWSSSSRVINMKDEPVLKDLFE
jgi:V8-like Glu-specific endopeptidase